MADERSNPKINPSVIEAFREYPLPAGMLWEFPPASALPWESPDGFVPISLGSLRAGFRLSQSNFIPLLLSTFAISPGQLVPNSWRYIMSFCQWVHNLRLPTFSVGMFSSIFTLSKAPRSSHYFYFIPRPAWRKLFTKVSDPDEDWKSHWAWVRFAAPFHFPAVWTTEPKKAPPLTSDAEVYSLGFLRYSLMSSGSIAIDAMSSPEALSQADYPSGFPGQGVAMPDPRPSFSSLFPHLRNVIEKEAVLFVFRESTASVPVRPPPPSAASVPAAVPAQPPRLSVTPPRPQAVSGPVATSPQPPRLSVTPPRPQVVSGPVATSPQPPRLRTKLVTSKRRQRHDSSSGPSTLVPSPVPPPLAQSSGEDVSLAPERQAIAEEAESPATSGPEEQTGSPANSAEEPTGSPATSAPEEPTGSPATSAPEEPTGSPATSAPEEPTGSPATSAPELPTGTPEKSAPEEGDTQPQPSSESDSESGQGEHADPHSKPPSQVGAASAAANLTTTADSPRPAGEGSSSLAYVGRDPASGVGTSVTPRPTTSFAGLRFSTAQLARVLKRRHPGPGEEPLAQRPRTEAATSGSSASSAGSSQPASPVAAALRDGGPTTSLLDRPDMAVAFVTKLSCPEDRARALAQSFDEAVTSSALGVVQQAVSRLNFIDRLQGSMQQLAVVEGQLATSKSVLEGALDRQREAELQARIANDRLEEAEEELQQERLRRHWEPTQAQVLREQLERARAEKEVLEGSLGEERRRFQGLEETASDLRIRLEDLQLERDAALEAKEEAELRREEALENAASSAAELSVVRVGAWSKEAGLMEHVAALERREGVLERELEELKLQHSTELSRVRQERLETLMAEPECQEKVLQQMAACFGKGFASCKKQVGRKHPGVDISDVTPEDEEDM